jgi:hypothetical protein
MAQANRSGALPARPQEGFRVTVEGCIVAHTHPQLSVSVIVALTFADWNPGAVTWSE